LKQLAEERAAKAAEKAAARAAQEAAVRAVHEAAAKIVREAAAKAAQEAAEKAAQEAAEKLAQETAANAAQEAAATVKETVFPSTKVVFGAGVTVQSVLTGYESCRVLVKNLPLTATKADVVTFFTQPGFDSANFTVYPPRESNDRSHREAVVEFEDAEDGKNAVVGLDEMEFGSEKLKLVVLTSKQGGMGKSKDRNSHILTVTWPAPSDTVFAAYSSMDEANSKRTELDGKTFNGRKVKANIAKKPSTLPDMYWNSATLSISGLEPGTSSTSIEEFCGATSIRMATRNTRSYDLNDAIPSLQSLVVQAHPENNESVTYETNIVPNEHGVVSAKITFPTWEHAKAVRDFLDQKSLPLCAQVKFFISLLPDPLHYTTYVPFPQYKAQEKLFQSLIPDQNDRSATTRLRILANQPDRAARVELLGSDKKTIGKLKVRIEQLTAGEKLPQWDPVFYGPEGEKFLEKVYEESQAYIRVDKRQRTLKVFGEPVAVEQAKAMIKDEVDRLASSQFEVFLKRASVRYFVDGARGSELLKQEVGEGNVVLDVSSIPCKIVVQGGESARHCLKKLVEESLSDAIRSQHQLKDGELCPVCYDNIDQSYRLGCGHAYCHGCFNHFLLSAFDTKKFPLSCMGDEGMCGVPIPIPVIQRFLLPAQVKNLLEVSFLDHVGRHPEKFRFCATPGCPEMYSRESDSGGVFQCRSCFVAVCLSCEEDHDGFTCEEWKVHRDVETQDKLLEGWAEGSRDVKKCPTCNIWIEKNGGCSRMTCPKCQAQICWKCLGVFTSAGDAYSHMERVHGGVFDVPDGIFD
jgi:RNA recognition motif-containing protein